MKALLLTLLLLAVTACCADEKGRHLTDAGATYDEPEQVNPYKPERENPFSKHKPDPWGKDQHGWAMLLIANDGEFIDLDNNWMLHDNWYACMRDGASRIQSALDNRDVMTFSENLGVKVPLYQQYLGFICEEVNKS